MRRPRVKRGNLLRSDLYRAVLTDTCPADIPIVVSNDGFHKNLRNKNPSGDLTALVDGLVRQNPERYTVPYRYRIRLSAKSSRQISLIHPAAQCRTSEFYGRYGHLIPYFCRHADISMRRPAKIGSTFFHLTSASARKNFKGAAIDLLLHDRTMRNPGSFFAYAGYDRLHKFFSSEEFVDLEKTFAEMEVTDISKCFSSIYSHTLAWAVKDVKHGKENVTATSFANDFDDLMQFSNYNETNGIPVGAEVSRIFAEIILQAVDSRLVRRAEKERMKFGRDYTVRRYIDDYIIFAHTTDAVDSLHNSLVEELGRFNLHLNDAKTIKSRRPFQTRKSRIVLHANKGVSSFRERVSRLDKESRLLLPALVRKPGLVVSSFVDDMKAACASSNADYDEISPYVIGAIANIIEHLIESYDGARSLEGFSKSNYANTFEVLMSSLYFFFSVHVTVPTSYQVSKLTILSIRFFAQKLPEFASSLYEVVRALMADIIVNPALSSVNLGDCVPIEILNVALASGELPESYKPSLEMTWHQILEDERIDYFGFVSMIFYLKDGNASFTKHIERTLLKRFLGHSAPLSSSHDAHFMLDLVACPYLSIDFRMKVVIGLYKATGLAVASVAARRSLVAEIEKNPWFVNWHQIDLLNHLRKKELSTVY